MEVLFDTFSFKKKYKRQFDLKKLPPGALWLPAETAIKENVMHDIIIVGGGPAGLTAALYALRAGKSVLVIEKSGFGGQIANSPKVENIPGTSQISGAEFPPPTIATSMPL